MFEPDEADLAWVPNNQREPREPNMREKYINWYENKYGVPDFSWSSLDIHHIIPLAYGGDNSYDNLMSLPKKFHQNEVTPWWASYGKYVPSGDDYYFQWVILFEGQFISTGVGWVKTTTRCKQSIISAKMGGFSISNQLYI
ncbi:hypothetical protein EMIT07CA2_400002 [Brevibacillus sp. IT-7CA2]|uniref:HNH endonuclease n=1 Tax=Brevibacillus sp. IT-7CA2 TaxID=3026436 RepID=UPI0039DF6B54